MRVGLRTTRLSLRQWLWLAAVGLPLLTGGSPAVAEEGNKRDLLTSKHNLAADGPGPVTSGKQDACIFCHTSHNSEPGAEVLWNRQLAKRTYNTYAVSTFSGGAANPEAGASKLCLSCHDGTVALGQTVSEGQIKTTGSMRSAAILLDGTSELTNDHPLGFQPEHDNQLVATLLDSPPASSDPVTVQLPGGRVECTSCHDPHKEDSDPVVNKFLVRSNSSGALCLACHAPSGWANAGHSTADNIVPTTDSFGPYGSVTANACSNCHKQHSTGTDSAAQLLLATEESTCALCHAGSNLSPSLNNVMGDFKKAYAHPTTNVSGLHDPAEIAFPLDTANRHAECTDCHNPHAAGGSGGATSPPAVQSALLEVSGYDGTAALRPAANEYQVCFKCHSDSTNKPQSPSFNTYGRTPDRAAEQSSGDPHNLRQKFNSSFARHNVTQPRQLSDAEVPSLRPYMLDANGQDILDRPLALGTYIYCTDCHASDNAARSGGTGANGPHGSAYPHVLTMRYELEMPPSTPGHNDGQGFQYLPSTFNPNGPFALCDRCHDLDRLSDEVSGGPFTGHRRHMAGEAASCATCHDPHGIQDAGGSASHDGMVSFDLSVVGPDSSNRLYFDSLNQECYLTCHAVEHSPMGY